MGAVFPSSKFLDQNLLLEYLLISYHGFDIYRDDIHVGFLVEFLELDNPELIEKPPENKVLDSRENNLWFQLKKQLELPVAINGTFG